MDLNILPTINQNRGLRVSESFKGKKKLKKNSTRKSLMDD
jgi:hypothetical protein